VSNPNDPRIQAYHDSLANYNYSIDQSAKKFGNNRKMAEGFYEVQERNKKVWQPLLDRPDVVKNITDYARTGVEQVPDLAYDIGGNFKRQVINGVAQPTKYGLAPTVYLGYSKPKQPVVYKEPLVEQVEPLTTRQPSIPVPSEIVTPVVRPIPTTIATKERPVPRKPPKAVMPSRQGGWGNQPLLMKLFPKLYER
jgi:hypothetical protein